MQILQIALPILTLALAVAALLWLRHEKQRGSVDGAADTARKALFLERAEAWLLGALPALITKAENEWFAFGTKTGPLKLAAVKAELLKIAPPELIATFNEFALDTIIDVALGQAKELWEELPGVLLRNQVPDAVGAEDGEAVDPLKAAEVALRHECAQRGLYCGIEIGTPCGPGAVGEPGVPGVAPEVTEALAEEFPGGLQGVPAEEISKVVRKAKQKAKPKEETE